jgi:hypothetical protein
VYSAWEGAVVQQGAMWDGGVRAGSYSVSRIGTWSRHDGPYARHGSIRYLHVTSTFIIRWTGDGMEDVGCLSAWANGAQATG